MKKILPLLLVLWINPLWSQKVSYQTDDQLLSKVLESLKVTYDLHFSYANYHVEDKRVKIQADEQNLEDFLYDLLRPLGLSYRFIKEDFIIIKPVAEIGFIMKAQIVDQEEASPLPFATIQIAGTYQGTFADENGNFQLELENPDSTDLEISFLGYEPIRINAQDFYIHGLSNITLKRQEFELAEVHIIEYLNDAITIDAFDDIFKINLRPGDMEILPGLAEPDVLYSIQMLPGVSSRDESASSINLRGSADDQGIIYWDRIPIYHSAHYFGLISSFIPSTVDQIDVYRSGTPIQYNGATAGLINMRSVQETPLQPTYEIGLNMTHGNAYALIPLLKNKSFIQLAARRSYNDLIETPTFKAFSDKLFDGSRLEDGVDIVQTLSGNNFENNSDFRFWDYNFKWFYQPSDKQEVSISLFRAKNALDVSSKDLIRENSTEEIHRINNFGANAFWKSHWSKQFSSEMSVTFTDYELREDLELIISLPNFFFQETTTVENEIKNLEIKSQLNWQTSKNNRFQLGYQFNRLESLTAYRAQNLFELDANVAFRDQGQAHIFFLNHEVQVQDRFRFDTGLRYSVFGYANQRTLEPVIRANYGPSDWLDFKFSFGVYRQYLRAWKDLDLDPSNISGNIWLLSDGEDVPLLRNIQTTFGAVLHHKGWLIDIELYHKKLSGLLARNYGIGNLEDALFTVGSGKVYGLDFMLKKRYKFYRTWLSYTLSRATNTFPIERIFFNSEETFVINQETFPGFLDARHQLNWAHTFQLQQFEFSLGWQYRSGLPVTPLVNTTPQLSPDGESRPPLLIWGNINSSRMPAFHRLDLSIWYNFPKKRSASWRGKIGLAFLNVYNRKNVWTRFFYPDDVDGNQQFEIIQEQKYLLRRTPNLSFSLIF